MADGKIPAEMLPDAISALLGAQKGEEGAHEALAAHFPEYGHLVMETNAAQYLRLASQAGLAATQILIMQHWTWSVSVDTWTSDFEFPLASVNLGDYASRAMAIEGAKRLTTDGGWEFPSEDRWHEFDCGGPEIHIPIHVQPIFRTAADG